MENKLLNNLFLGLFGSVVYAKRLLFVSIWVAIIWFGLCVSVMFLFDSLSTSELGLLFTFQGYFVLVGLMGIIYLLKHQYDKLSMIKSVLDDLNRTLTYPSETKPNTVITLNKALEDMTIEDLENMIEWAVSHEEYIFANTLKERLNSLKK